MCPNSYICKALNINTATWTDTESHTQITFNAFDILEHTQTQRCTLFLCQHTHTLTHRQSDYSNTVCHRSDRTDMLNSDSMMSFGASKLQTYNYAAAQIKAFFFCQHTEVCRSSNSRSVLLGLERPWRTLLFDNWTLCLTLHVPD